MTKTRLAKEQIAFAQADTETPMAAVIRPMGGAQRLQCTALMDYDGRTSEQPVYRRKIHGGLGVSAHP